MKKYIRFSLIGLCAMPMLLWSQEGSAIPAFARKYHTACSTCHIAFPARNGFGEAFRNNGYRFPDGTDEEMVKEEPIQLGSDAYKKQFPNAIWPSDIPNMPSLGFLARLNATSSKVNNSGKFKGSDIGEELDVFFAGTITEQISYIGDFGMTNVESPTLGRLQLLWTFKPGITVALGTVGFPEQFDMISLSAGGDLNGYAAQLPSPNKGVELRIAGDSGSVGYSLLAGFGRNPQSDEAEEQPDGLEHGGTFDDSKFARASIKFGGAGLMSGSGGTLGNQSIGLDNSVTLGLNIFHSEKGGNVNAEDYTSGLTKTAWGGDIRANYGNLRLVAQYSRFNEVIDPLTGIDYGKRNAVSLEGDYWFYPWLFGAIRYEHLKDSYNGKYTKIIPGIGALLRPNCKIGLEYVDVTKSTVIDNGFNLVPTSSMTFYAQLGF
ncbi:MAG: hypothetical protein HGB15_00220 [Chlorobaculum sp.]|nr:hypothetical protein [Chlorobaculum sp.]